jgi:hypothetical protein
MNAARIASLVAALVLAAPPTLAAQQESLLAPGERIRVSAPALGIEQLVCTVSAFSPDSVVVEDRGTLLALPLVSVTKLEVYRGQRSQAGKGAVTGLLVGGGAGALFGLIAVGASEAGDWGAGYVLGGALICAGLGGGVGALIGAGVGQRRLVERWEPVLLYPSQGRLPPPAGPRLAIGLSLRF